MNSGAMEEWDGVLSRVSSWWKIYVQREWIHERVSHSSKCCRKLCVRRSCTFYHHQRRRRHYTHRICIAFVASAKVHCALAQYFFDIHMSLTRKRRRLLRRRLATINAWSKRLRSYYTSSPLKRNWSSSLYNTRLQWYSPWNHDTCTARITKSCCCCSARE